MLLDQCKRKKVTGALLLPLNPVSSSLSKKERLKNGWIIYHILVITPGLGIWCFLRPEVEVDEAPVLGLGRWLDG